MRHIKRDTTLADYDRAFTMNINPNKLRWIIGVLLVFAVVFLYLTDLLFTAIEKVFAGKGFEGFETIWFLDFNYSGVLVFFGCFFLVLIVGVTLRVREYFRWLDFEKSMKKKSVNSPSKVE